MKTNQIIKRSIPITGIEGEIYEEAIIRQRTKDRYVNATDILKIYNKITGENKRMSHFFDKKETEEFSELVERQEISKGRESGLLINTSEGGIGFKKKAYEKTRGRYGGTWMHPYLFTDFAMWLSPEFKLFAIKILNDNKIDFRISSGDLFKKMCRSIKRHYSNCYDKAPDSEIYQEEARLIKGLAELDEDKDWNEASERQLKLREKLQEANTFAHEQGYSRQKRMTFLQQQKELFNSKN